MLLHIACTYDRYQIIVGIMLKFKKLFAGLAWVDYEHYYCLFSRADSIATIMVVVS